eukprot:5533537-Amphidinium_carterae.1
MATAASNPVPAIVNPDNQEDARGKVLSSPGVDEESSETEEEVGAQDQQDRATEGPLGARKIAKYAPYHQVTNSDPFKGGVARPTGSDMHWALQVGIKYGTAQNGYEALPEPGRGRYRCPACATRFQLSESLADHMNQVHSMGLEPNFCNEYSVAELVSGVNNLAVGKKFRVDDGETKPKFVLKKPAEVKIPWMGHPIYNFENEPISLETIHDEEGEVFARYREPPQGQLSTERPAIDLRRRLRPGDDAEPEVEPPTARRPLIPAALTSQLWWTKMIDPVTNMERQRRANGEAVEEPEEESFSHMSPWRNVVRAWEMRNHENLITQSWHEVCYPDPHPADMTVLTQGATMTPTVMKEGQWDTWSYGDLMVPEHLRSMMAKDHDGHDVMSDVKKNRKWYHVIRPLLDSLGFKMVGKDGSEWNPPNGVIYYQDFYGRFESLQKKYRVPDPSLFVNHEVIHYIAHQSDIAQALNQWEEHALQEEHFIFDTRMCVPGRLEQFQQQTKYEANDSKTGVETAFARCQTFQLHGPINVVEDWTLFLSYVEDSIERLPVWDRPSKTNDIEMASSYVGRTPLTFVKTGASTRKTEELSNSQESETKRRRVENIVALLDHEQNTGSGDVTMSASSGEPLTINTNDVLELQRDPMDRTETSPVDVLDQGEDEELVLSTTKELKVMKEEDEIKYWKQMWKECEHGLSLNLDPSTTRDSFFDRKMKAIVAAKEEKHRMFDSYLIQRFPLNESQRNVRGSGHYDPNIQWYSENLVGTLAMSPQRELAWAVMRTLIRSTPSPSEAEEHRKETRMSYDDVADKMLNFFLQYHGDERDIRGEKVYQPRAANREQRLTEHLAAIIKNRKLSVVELQYRLVSLSNDAIFYEQVVQWWQAIGKIILPRLRERKVIDQNLHTLPQLLTFMYKVMTTVYMKDISHIGAMGQYGNDGAACEEGSEQIHITDFGNQLYAQVIRDGSLPNYTDITPGFSDEDKGDVLETMMGLNFLEKEHRVSFADMGITALEDAQETMLKVEWYTFRRGLEWSLAYFQEASPITAIVAMREACTNYVSYVGERGMTLNPVMRSRRCLGCGKKRNNAKQAKSITCYPRLFQSLVGHLESNGCVQDFIRGVDDLRFEHFYNLDDVMKKWWKRRKRAFV